MNDKMLSTLSGGGLVGAMLVVIATKVTGVEWTDVEFGLMIGGAGALVTWIANQIPFSSED